MADWRTVQLTHGSDASRFHSHSYYDIPVFDAAGDRILAHRMTMQGRAMRPDDSVDIGIINVSRPGHFEPIAQSTSWSWQQGPLAQWVAGGPQIVFNSRIDGRFRAQIVDTSCGTATILPRTVYAAAPDGSAFYGLNMRRLEHLRPGYGYATYEANPRLERTPCDDGIWQMDRAGGNRLVLSIDTLRRFFLGQASLAARARHRLGDYAYWLNHLKLSPNGSRFTVKLRWRREDGPWSDRQSVSLTGRVDGTALRVLGRGLSHVMWLNEWQLYAWHFDRLVLLDDAADNPVPRAPIAPGLISQNVHIRHLPPGASETLSEAVFDTPYRETVDLVHYWAGGAPGSARHRRIARFANHVPAIGPLRCDLHPCLSPDGNRIAVTSLQDGGRQIYLLERESRNQRRDGVY